MEEIFALLGSFGRYQCFLYALLFIAGFNGGLLSLNFSWTGFTPNVRCRLPIDAANADYQPNWFKNDTARSMWYPHPKNKDAAKSLCTYCPTGRGTCVDGNARHCDLGIIYDHSIFQSTLVEKYGLVCDSSYKKEFVRVAFMLGLFLSNPLIMPLADRFGRFPALITMSIVNIVFVNAKFFLEGLGYAPLLICELLSGICHYGTFLPAYIVFMEVVDGLPKTICGVWYQAHYTVGMLYSVLIAYYVRDWKMMLAYYGIPTITYALYIWLYPESIRWAIANDKEQQAQKLVKRGARWNRVEIPASMVKRAADEYKHKQGDSTEHANVFQLFTNGWLLARNTLIIMFTWLAISMGYFGLAFNTSDLPGNVFVSFTLSAVSEFPGYVICVPMMEKLGRRPTFVILLGSGGLACIGSGLIPNATVRLVLAMVGKMGVAAAFAVVYNYSAEIFPTVVRVSGTSLGSASARIGSMAAPLIHNLAYYVDEWVPIVIYGSFAVVAAGLDFLLPETKGREYPETIEDAKHFNDQQYWEKKAKTRQDQHMNANGGGDKDDNGNLNRAYSDSIASNGDYDRNWHEIELSMDSK